ncbi:MAG TPA: D-2-hydroxyacid dehydrogenase, partial [Gammaproteobacteria bacterium]|nr:D-2-hydroxyacid dehydrogenase [Gammaproteobacteria bacterium]
MASSNIRSFARALLATGCLAAAGPLAAQARDCDALCEAGAALVERFDLREGDTPVRERPGWAPPQKIVVADVAVADALRPLAPGAEVVGVPGLRNFAGMAEVIADADVLVGLCTPELIARAQKLRWIQLLNAGADSCATIPAVAERGILVTNLQRIQGPHMAEHAIALMLALARSLPVYASEQHAGAFTRGFRELRAERPFEIEGKTLLVVGLGGIGTEVAKRAHGLGMHVIATRNSSRSGPDYVEYVGLADEYLELARRADVVVNATPLTAATRGMFDERFFGTIKEGALFINIGRGESVVTDALVAALRSNRVAGAGLDVTDPEPLPPGHAFWTMENVIVTPHIATNSDFRNERTLTLVAENLRRYVRGDKLLSIVDLAQGY